MKVYYEERDLVTFGEYLLSEERSKRIEDYYQEGDTVTIQERKSQVYHVDMENWKEKQKEDVRVTA